MKLADIVKQLELDVLAGESLLDREITGGYVSDILSDVLTHACEGNIWITRQIHLNIVPIAGAKEIAGIIIVKHRQPYKEALEKANAEKVPVLGTGMNAFQLAGKLYQMGIRGSDEDV